MTPGKAEVIVWLRKTDSFPVLRTELLGLAGDEPDESTDYQGMVDFHWSFSHVADAERMASALTPLTSWPELVLLRSRITTTSIDRLHTKTSEFADISPRRMERSE